MNITRRPVAEPEAFGEIISRIAEYGVNGSICGPAIYGKFLR